MPPVENPIVLLPGKYIPVLVSLFAPYDGNPDDPAGDRKRTDDEILNPSILKTSFPPHTIDIASETTSLIPVFGSSLNENGNEVRDPVVSKLIRPGTREDVIEYDAVVGVNVMLVAALAVVANDAVSAYDAVVANDAVITLSALTAWDAEAGVNVIVSAALAVTAKDADVANDAV